MTLRVAYFAFDRGDAATRRRIAAFEADGIAVDGFAMRRRDDDPPPWLVADLGLTRDNAYAQRVASILRGVCRALAQREILAAADVMLARNLDMLAVAALTRATGGLKQPLIYECLDIHRLMVREDFVGRLFRAAEGLAMAHASALWVSSPAFLRNYFEPMHGARLPRLMVSLVENRIAPAPGFAPRPSGARAAGHPLRLGWFGNLRCARSLALMETLADKFRGRLEITLNGYPALTEIPDFDARVDRPGIVYGGRYRAPEDLAELYDGVDLVWAGDFMDAGFNSSWLLPNRLYEGGWFACPPIAPDAVETGRWIAERNVGFTVSEPIEETLPALISVLIEDRGLVAAARAALLASAPETFMAEKGAAEALVEAILKREGAVAL